MGNVDGTAPVVDEVSFGRQVLQGEDVRLFPAVADGTDPEKGDHRVTSQRMRRRAVVTGAVRHATLDEGRGAANEVMT